MKRGIWTMRRPFTAVGRLLGTGVVFGVLALPVGRASATICTPENPCPTDCNTNATGCGITANVNGSPTSGPVNVGDVITYSLSLSIPALAPGNIGCNFKLGQLSAILPDLTVVQTAGFGGATPDVPEVSTATPFFINAPTTYTVLAADAGTTITALLNYGSTVSQPAQTNGTFLAATQVTSASCTTSNQLTVNSPTATPTNTNTPTDTPTDTPTNTPTDTPTNTPTDTPTNTPTDTPTNTPTNTNTPTPTPTSAATVVGCRITGGRIIDELSGALNGDMDITKATGGGQVGAPCGCIGCFDSFDNIQGNWEHSRKKKQGSFKATDFNSLVCGCECDQDGEALLSSLDGTLCNPDNRVCGPEPRRAPANLACFSGTGEYSETGGKKTEPVAFRVEVEDHGEPGGGSDKDATEDQYRIWIYRLQGAETVKGLAVDICCHNPDTDVADPAAEEFGAGRPADIFDGSNLIHGNLQIHPQIASHTDTCPVPDTSCPVPLP